MEMKQEKQMSVMKVFYISPKDDFSSVTRQHVANVRINEELFPSVEDALEFAYRRTQNIFGSWSMGSRIPDGFGDFIDNGDFSTSVDVMAPLHMYNGRPMGHRSSMPNDEFEYKGILYRCASMGFYQVGINEEA
jgi:hypothetical protein